MLDVCVVVDVEDFISFRQGNPSWNLWQIFKGKINNLIKGIRYDKGGFEKIYNLAVKKRFPCSFMLVGSLFKPKQDAPRFVDFGYHTLNHKPLTLISDSEIQEEIKNITGAKSFSAPMWMIEDAKNSGRIFRALKKEKYKIAVYRGIDNKHESRISKSIMKYGIKCIYTSNWFDGERNFKVREILNEIIQNSGKNAVYCITAHDFSNKNMKNFEALISGLKEMEKKGIIRIKNLSQL